VTNSFTVIAELPVNFFRIQRLQSQKFESHVDAPAMLHFGNFQESDHPLPLYFALRFNFAKFFTKVFYRYPFLSRTLLKTILQNIMDGGGHFPENCCISLYFQNQLPRSASSMLGQELIERSS
jgi:hypothetical protein